ncbi:CAP domain-containing protein [Dethiothermospora halolimnae]|uniref:CAP domain-containing protein n=1 Tax=Dethiothermospora halolimnae TaxID=3114390 RepID=UPI003CCC11F2
MTNKKKILGLITGSLVLISSNTIALADIVIDNNDYSNSYGYSIKRNTTIENSINEDNNKNTIIEDTNKKENKVTIPNNNQNINSNSYYIKSYNPYSYGSKSYSLNDAKNKSYSISPDGESNANNNNEINQDSQLQISTKERILLDLINQEREKRGLNPLKIDKTLFEVAQTKSEDMYNNNYFSHTSPTFGKTYSLIREKGVKYIRSGENIGRTYSVYRAHNGFMNSEGHRANILNPNFTHIGIGIKGNYYTEVFIQK